MHVLYMCEAKADTQWTIYYIQMCDSSTEFNWKAFYFIVSVSKYIIKNYHSKNMSYLCSEGLFYVIIWYEDESQYNSNQISFSYFCLIILKTKFFQYFFCLFLHFLYRIICQILQPIILAMILQSEIKWSI